MIYSDLLKLSLKYNLNEDQLKALFEEFNTLKHHAVSDQINATLDANDLEIKKDKSPAQKTTIIVKEQEPEFIQSTIDGNENSESFQKYQSSFDQFKALFETESEDSGNQFAVKNTDEKKYLSKRYRDIGLLGEGSMGEVRLVFDEYIGRSVAMKLLKQYKINQDKINRFIAEAKFQARLQHPGIIPIYDMNQLKDGRIFFTMRAVQGKTFYQVIREVQKTCAKEGFLAQSKSGWSFRKLIAALTQFCEIVSFAHSQGIIHRDLKPQNLMIGPYQEALILDWGIAKLLEELQGSEISEIQHNQLSIDEEDGELEHKQRIADLYKQVDSISTMRSTQQTLLGTISGTPAYMSPEQAQGRNRDIGPRTDVYALGAILYHILTGKPPYEGKNMRVLLKDIALSRYPKLKHNPSASYPPKKREVEPSDKHSTPEATPSSLKSTTHDGDQSAPSSSASAQSNVNLGQEDESKKHDEIETPAPIELIQICEKAMSFEYDQRYEDAGFLSKDLNDWLDGIRQRNQALVLVDQALALMFDQQKLMIQAEAILERAKKNLSEIHSWESDLQKRDAWALEDQGLAIKNQINQISLEIEFKIQSALSMAQNLEEANEVACEYYLKLHQRSVKNKNKSTEERAFNTLKRHTAQLPNKNHKKHTYQNYIDGIGLFEISLQEDEVIFEIFEVKEENRRWQKGNAVHQETANQLNLHLPMNQYRCEIKKGKDVYVYPFEMKRQSHWKGNQNQQGKKIELKLPSTSLPQNEILVLAGAYTSGDLDAPRSYAPITLYLDSFVIQKYPVTHEEYLLYLNDLIDQGKEEIALLHVPQELSATSTKLGKPLYARDQHGYFCLDPHQPELAWTLKTPVVMVNWFDACAYADWFSQRTQQSWRLPTEYEWEKAARGSDGRIYPWGDFFDPSWCCNRLSHSGTPKAAEIDAFPIDCSPYGVRGMGGNIAEWCLDEYVDQIAYRDGDDLSMQEIKLSVDAIAHTARGGAWDDGPMFCRSAVRHRGVSHYRRSSLGFRLCRFSKINQL